MITPNSYCSDWETPSSSNYILCVEQNEVIRISEVRLRFEISTSNFGWFQQQCNACVIYLQVLWWYILIFWKPVTITYPWLKQLWESWVSMLTNIKDQPILKRKNSNGNTEGIETLPEPAAPPTSPNGVLSLYNCKTV